ncbi:MAG: WhiB family transcriptional regulator [Burkholderiaceae bacterium]|nr:MAG: WhiB family transcriptional regulator [Burkholderiaceae bacterium]
MTARKAPPEIHVQAAMRDPRVLEAFATRSDVDPMWRDRAACKDVDPELFYTEGMGMGNPAGLQYAAMMTCQRCPVQTPCLARALDTGDLFAVMGCTTPADRNPMIVAWRRLLDAERAAAVDGELVSA